ncbi:MAG: PH domain-containing protein [Thermoplasmata archaeon]
MAISRPLLRMVHVWALKVLLIPVLFWLPLLFVFLLPFLADPRARPQIFPVLTLVLIPGAAILVLSYAWALLYGRSYRWREAEEELHVWRGVLFRKRISIPYARVQNVNVVRGPLLLLFGLSGVEVETAGQKGYSSAFYRTEGYLPGVIRGEELADSILERVRGERTREAL